MRYENNRLACYDRKEFLESISKLRREKNTAGSLQIDPTICLDHNRLSKLVMIKTKSRLWKAIVNLQPETNPPQKRKRITITFICTTVTLFAND